VRVLSGGLLPIRPKTLQNSGHIGEPVVGEVAESIFTKELEGGAVEIKKTIRTEFPGFSGQSTNKFQNLKDGDSKGSWQRDRFGGNNG